MIGSALPYLMAIILIAAITAQRSSAQVVPSGSYQQSCSNAVVQGNQLIATCGTEAGTLVRTTLQSFGGCIDDIANLDGELACNFDAIPSGSYQQSCRNYWVDPQHVHATCGRANGTERKALLL